MDKRIAGKINRTSPRGDLSLPQPTQMSRRMFLATTGSFLAMPALADRPVLSGRRNAMTCDNTSAPISALQMRLATPGEFQNVGTCKLLRTGFEGPYFLCADVGTGKDLTEGLPGQPLTVALRISGKDCEPITDAIVDIWSCGADGRYSGQNASPDVVARSGKHAPPENNVRYGRGVFQTDRDGIAEWDTLYPGYYAGRAIHIHFKVHWQGRSYLTNQGLLPETWNQRVMQTKPYNTNRPIDRILPEQEGRMALPYFEVLERGNRMMALINVRLA